MKFASSENISICGKLHYLDLASVSDKELLPRWLHFCSTIFLHLDGSFTCKKAIYIFFSLSFFWGGKLGKSQFKKKKNKSKANGHLLVKNALWPSRKSFTNWMGHLGVHSNLPSSTTLAFLVTQKSILNHATQ